MNFPKLQPHCKFVIYVMTILSGEHMHRIMKCKSTKSHANKCPKGTSLESNNNFPSQQEFQKVEYTTFQDENSIFT